MARKRIKGTILAVTALTFGAITLSTVGLTSCQPTVTDNKLDVTEVTIANADALKAAWKAGEADRKIELSFGDATVNVAQAIKDGSIVITSSDATVVTPVGQYLSALKEGTATITVTVHAKSGDLTATVDLTIEKAMVAPEAVEASVSELLAMDFDAWSAQRPQPIYRVTGVAGGWYGKTDSGYGEVSEPSKYGNFYLHDAEDPETTILVYGAGRTSEALKFNGDGTWTQSAQDFVDGDGNTPFVKGDTVTLDVMLAVYNGVIQVKGYIVEVVPGVKIDYESITLETDKTSVKIGEYATLKHVALPENANVGSVTYEITEGEDVVEIVGSKVYGRKAGKATIVAKGGSITSEPVTIEVSSTEITYSTIQSVYSKKKGDEVAVYGKFLGEFKGEKNYGIFIGDGDYALFLFGAEVPEGVKEGDGLKVSGKVDVYNGGFQLAKGADILKDDKTRGVAPRTLDLKTLSGVDGKDTGRRATATGTVEGHKVDSYGTVTFNLVNGDVSIPVEADNRYVPAATLAEFTNIKDGDTLTVFGNITFYVKGASELPTTSEGLKLVNPSIDHSKDPANTIASAYEAGAGAGVRVYGAYLGTFIGDYGFFIGDGETALFVYKGEAPEDVKVGDVLLVEGLTDCYNGGFQVKESTVSYYELEGTPATPVTLDLSTLDGVDGKDAGRVAKVTGTVSGFETDKFGNIDFTVTNSNGDAIAIHNDSRYVAESILTELESIKDGDTVTIEGYVGFYNKEAGTNLPTDATGLQLVNARLVK